MTIFIARNKKQQPSDDYGTKAKSIYRRCELDAVA
jgi:hypothetical protein